VNLPVLYLHGFASGPSSSKARIFSERLQALGREVAVPALDGGDFRGMTLTSQLQIIEKTAANRPCVLIGSSLGGYLAALYAARHPEVDRVILMAPAFGFARRWGSSLGLDVLDHWQQSGARSMMHHGLGREAEIGWTLMEDAALYEEMPAVSQPVLILHGIHDDVVPVSISREFAANRPNVTLIEYPSDHQLLDVVDDLIAQTRDFLGLLPPG
jgi:uncharacterized protein